ncbi:MAG: hypothetical protein KJO50_07670 [Bacteroidia bacterium]|nr:hypothetical protein [Bacteroidia bacterium]
MANVLDVILKTIEDVQQKNRKNPNEETADPSVFDLLRKKIQEVDGKVQSNQVQKGRRNAKSILDIIKDGIEGARKENRADNKVATAPKSVFEDLLKKIEKGPQRQAATGIRKIVQDFNLDVSRVPKEMLGQIQSQYQGDVKKLNQSYAQAIYNVTKKLR